MRLIGRVLFLWIIYGVLFAWVAWNGGLLVRKPGARVVKIGFILAVAILVSTFLLYRLL